MILVALAAAAAFVWWRWPAAPLDAAYTPSLSPTTWPADGGPPVLIDNAHWNGVTSARGFAGLAALLRADGYRVLADGNATRAEMLADARIAVVANPLGFSGWLRGRVAAVGLPPLAVLDDEALWLQEMETVLQWVDNGGSLLVAVDEGAPARGVRGLATRLGVTVGTGVVVDLGHSEPRAPERLIFSRETGLIGTHPIVDGFQPVVNRVVSVGGPALAGPPEAETLLRFSASAAEVPRLGTSPADGTPVGGLARALAFERGRGRVVVVADTSLLTALVDDNGQPYGLAAAGTNNERFARYVLRWLSRRDASEP